MTARALIAHGGPQRLPTRAAPSLVRALRDARGSPPWTPWTILCRFDRHHPSYATCIRVDGANRCDPTRLVVVATSPTNYEHPPHRFFLNPPDVTEERPRCRASDPVIS